MVWQSIVMTEYGPVLVSENTAAILRERFPYWDDPWPMRYTDRSQSKPEKLLIDAATALAALCNACGQELVEI